VALEVADKGVRVNSVNPGVIVTNLHKRAGQDEETYKKFLEHSKTTHALGRVGTADEGLNNLVIRYSIVLWISAASKYNLFDFLDWAYFCFFLVWSVEDIRVAIKLVLSA